MRAKAAGLVAACLLIAGCADKKNIAEAPRSEPAGQLDIAVGNDVRQFGLAEADCAVVEAGGERFLKVSARSAVVRVVDGERTIPYLLTARLPADLGKDKLTFGPDDPIHGAIASVPGAEYDGEEYPLLQVIARSVQNGATGYECAASRKAEKLSVICNGGKVLPWSAPGPIPSGSFQATVDCNI